MALAPLLVAVVIVLLTLAVFASAALIAPRADPVSRPVSMAAALAIPLAALAMSRLAAGPSPVTGGRRRRPSALRAPGPPGLFASARAICAESGPGVLAGRVRRFFRTVGRGFHEGARLALSGPSGDAATLAAMRRAWRDASRPQPNPEGRAARRISGLSALQAWGQVRAAAQSDSAFKLLDVGAADGSITAALAGELGLPPSRAAACDVVELPPAAEPRLFEFRLADGNSLPFGSEEFDLVTAFMSAHHFADAGRMFREMWRVAKPGARFLLREHGLWAGAEPRAAAVFYDIVHAFYEAVARDEKSPERWAADYAAGLRPAYRDADAWVAVAADAGWDLVEKAGPAADNFDTVHALFRKRAGPAGSS